MTTWVLLAPYLAPIIGMLCVFGMPVAIVYIVKYFKALEKGLIGPAAGAGLPALPALQERLLRLEREKQLLESRVAQLEILSAALPPAAAAPALPRAPRAAPLPGHEPPPRLPAGGSYALPSHTDHER